MGYFGISLVVLVVNLGFLVQYFLDFGCFLLIIVKYFVIIVFIIKLFLILKCSLIIIWAIEVFLALLLFKLFLFFQYFLTKEAPLIPFITQLQNQKSLLVFIILKSSFLAILQLCLISSVLINLETLFKNLRLKQVFYIFSYSNCSIIQALY